MASSIAIGIDLGGTNLKVAVVDRGGSVRAQRTCPVDAARGPGAVIADVVGTVDTVLATLSLDRSDLIGVGLGAPGPMNLGQGRIIRAANLPGWHDVPIRDQLSDAIGLPVVFDNDGNAAAFGEFWVGAGRDVSDMVMFTLGTGIGAGVIIDGALLHGHFDNAAELGHMIVVADGLPCSCGQHGCLEQYASAGNVSKRARAAVDAGERSALADLARAGDEIDAADVAQCAKAGDALALRLWDEACRYLAVACGNVQHAYNPACVILGGGMSGAGDFLLDRVRACLDERKWLLHDDLPTVKVAALGYDAGVIGAAGLAWQALNERR